MIDLTEFLREGKISEYIVGIDSSSIPNIDELEKHYFDSEDPSFGYSIFDNEIELSITDNELTCISVDAAGNHITLLNKFNISVYTTLDKVIDYLTYMGLTWEFNSRHSFGQQLMLDLSSGVQISFRYEEGYGLLMSRIQKYSF